MCGRFVRNSPIAIIAGEFNIGYASIKIAPSYNIAPSQNVLIINSQGIKQLTQCRWGFIPAWAKDPSIGHKMINARAETVSSKPAFKSAFKKQRCLIIADGFYEWEKQGKGKVPYYIHLKSGKPFGIAGIYNNWTSETGESICCCAIITTTSNELLEPIHDRMPVIVSKAKEDLWLDPDMDDNDILLGLLKPYPSDLMAMHEVSTKVNSPVYDSPDVIDTVLKNN